MTEEIKDRNFYFAVVTCTAPVKTTVTVAAYDIEHAKALVTEMFKNEGEVEIVDIYDLRETDKMNDALAESSFPTTPKTIN